MLIIFLFLDYGTLYVVAVIFQLGSLCQAKEDWQELSTIRSREKMLFERILASVSGNIVVALTTRSVPFMSTHFRYRVSSCSLKQKLTSPISRVKFFRAAGSISPGSKEATTSGLLGSCYDSFPEYSVFAVFCSWHRKLW